MFGRPRSGVRRSRRARSNQSNSTQRTYRRKPLFELLEDRRMLAVLTVNTNLDTSTPGDGLVTLREAIIAANNDTTTDLGQTGSGADTIQFTPNLSGATIQLGSTGELKITSVMTIDASSLPGGLTVKAFDNDATPNNGNGTRVFNIDDGNATAINVSLTGITLTGGDVAGPGGGILSRENLTITDSTITGNAATLGASAIFSGGGIAEYVGQLYLIAHDRFCKHGSRDGRRHPGLSNNERDHYQFHDIGQFDYYGHRFRRRWIGDFGQCANFRSAVRQSAGIRQQVLAAASISTRILPEPSPTAPLAATPQVQAAAASSSPLRPDKRRISCTPRLRGNTSDNDVSGSGSGGGLYLRALAAAGGTVTVKNTIIAGNTDFTNIASDIDNTSPANHPTLNQSFTLVGNNKGSGLAAGAAHRHSRRSDQSTSGTID